MSATTLMLIISAGWGVKSGAEADLEANLSPEDTDFPFGRFFVVEIPEHPGERAEMREAVFSDDTEQAEEFDQLKAGWYFVVQANDGTIYVTPCKDKEAAFQRYDKIMRAYALWNRAQALKDQEQPEGA